MVVWRCGRVAAAVASAIACCYGAALRGEDVKMTLPCHDHLCDARPDQKGAGAAGPDNPSLEAGDWPDWLGRDWRGDTPEDGIGYLIPRKNIVKEDAALLRDRAWRVDTPADSAGYAILHKTKVRAQEDELGPSSGATGPHEPERGAGTLPARARRSDTLEGSAGDVGPRRTRNQGAEGWREPVQGGGALRDRNRRGDTPEDSAGYTIPHKTKVRANEDDPVHNSGETGPQDLERVVGAPSTRARRVDTFEGDIGYMLPHMAKGRDGDLSHSGKRTTEGTDGAWGVADGGNGRAKHQGVGALPARDRRVDNPEDGTDYTIPRKTEVKAKEDDPPRSSGVTGPQDPERESGALPERTWRGDTLEASTSYVIPRRTKVTEDDMFQNRGQVTRGNDGAEYTARGDNGQAKPSEGRNGDDLGNDPDRMAHYKHVEAGTVERQRGHGRALPEQARRGDNPENVHDYMLRRKDAVGDDEQSLAQWSTLKVGAAAAMLRMNSGFDRPWEEGEEPAWWHGVKEEGYEFQSSGYDMWQLASRVEERIRHRRDPRYAAEAIVWLDSLRRVWEEESRAHLPPRWGQVPEPEILYFEEDVELTLRQQWLEQLCPVACEHSRRDHLLETAGFRVEGPPCEAEREEARRMRLSRSRTPQRQRMTGRVADHRQLLSRRQSEAEPEPEELSLVVKKFLLKKRDSKSFRKLVDNPSAWREGPGVRVTTTTRVLAPRTGARGRSRGQDRGRGGGSSGADRCQTSRSSEERGTSGGRGRAANPSGGAEREVSTAGGEGDDEGEPLDELGASFLWRTLLGLDTDSDYEDEQPQRMPGFINEPAYSTVFETLMDKSPAEFQVMADALPNFVGLLSSELHDIVARVVHERGLGTSSAARSPTASGSAELPGEAAASPAPPPAEVHDVDEDVDIVFPQEDETEVEVDVEDDDTSMMQTTAHEEPLRTEAQRENPREAMVRLRDWVEDRWAEDHQVADMIAAVGRAFEEHLAAGEDRNRGREWLMTVLSGVPDEARRCDRREAVRLPPQQQDWVEAVTKAVVAQVQEEKAETDENGLMQRSLTGMHREARERMAPPCALTVHTELQDMGEETARQAAAALLQRLQRHRGTIAEWSALEAVLVAHSANVQHPVSAPGRCSPGVDPVAWVQRWGAKLVSAQRGVPQSLPASSHEVPVVSSDGEDVDQLYREREEEEEKHNQADLELFEWHERHRARMAQVEDRAVVQAHLGWSTATAKHLKLKVKLGDQTMEVGVEPGEDVNMVVTVTEQKDQAFYYRGEKQDRTEAEQQLREREEEHMAEEMAGELKRRRTGQRIYNTADEDVRPWYQLWLAGGLEMEEMIKAVGVDMAEFIVAAAAINPADAETQVGELQNQATLQYGSQGPVMATQMDEAHQGIFPSETDSEASTAELQRSLRES